jgi:cytochrome c553
MLRSPLLLAFVLAVPAGAAEPIDNEFFERKVRPIFAAHCTSCHDAKKAKGGLQLTSRAAALRGGDTGAAVVPGDPAQSLLVRVVRYENDLRMPPKGKLSADEIAALTAWVQAGAPWPEANVPAVLAESKGFDVQAIAAGHWSFQPITRPELPAVRDIDWVRTPIDRFILAKLEAAGMKPAPPADPRTLIRRISFALTGLPPTPEEVEAFAREPSSQAYAALVEKLLASPHYGERWGRHWLDLARYAETMGHEFDFEIPNAWRYRDFVIRAFNFDLPFDRFIREQIAGDLLPNPRRHPEEGWNESIVGTGFWLLGEAKHSPVDIRQDQADRMENMIDVFGKTFLGLTVACARCHDHKFDPIPTRDFYGLYGMLASSRYQQAFLDDPAAVEADLRELKASRDALAQWAVPAPEPSQLEPSADLQTWRAESRLFEDFTPGWAARWSLSGPAFQANDDYPHSGRESASLRGVLRSPTFTIESDRITVLVAGKGSQVNVIIDNYQLIQNPIYGGLKKGIDHGEEFRWATFDVARWKGHAAYLEFIDDGPGYIAVAEVRFADATPPNVKLGTTTPPPAIPTLPADAPTAAKQLAHRARDVEAKLASPRRAPALLDGTGRNERVFIRGNHKTLGEDAPRRFLEVFTGPDANNPTAGSGRLELANALIDPSNPLVARVLVNRVWHHHFGVGLVPSTDDFGRQGQPPSHPELLDWLASEFVANGWSIKNLHRLIVLSNTYQMASRPHPDTVAVAATADPQNRLLHRMNVRRLEAEAIRDAILTVSGRLDRTIGGPGVPPHLTEHMTGRGRPAQSGPLDGDGRRSVYLQVRRNFLNPMFTAFDYPTPFTTIGRRGTSNVPAQALVMLNNPFVVQQAQRWAQRVWDEATAPAERVRRMYAAAFSRLPTDAEIATAVAFVTEQTAAGLSPPQTWVALAHAMLNAKEFVFVE